MLEGWYFITVALLVLSGGSKVRDPEPTRGALRAAGLPSARWVVLVLAGGEIVVGASGLAFFSPLVSAAVAVFYIGFAGFVAVALVARLPLQSCGCFGTSDTPPGWIHVSVNVAAAAAATFFALTGGVDLFGVLASQPAAGVPYLGFVAIGTVLLALVLSELPAVLARRAA